MDRSRLEAFSDGVFAVAITLLALNLVVEGPSSHMTLWQQLGDKTGAFLAYLVSFTQIGIIWVNHHTLLRAVARVDRILLYLNLLLLMFVVLIPFATATVADYLGQNGGSAHLAMAVYNGVYLGMAVGFGAMFEWTLHSGRRHVPLPPETHMRARIRFAAGSLAYVAGIFVAYANATASFVLVAVVAVYYIAERTPAMEGTGGGPGSGDPNISAGQKPSDDGEDSYPY